MQWTVRIDGEPQAVELRPDFFVTKDGKTFVAEVKTGVRAPDPLHRPTRRQLVEYAAAFAPYDVLLVDMERAKIVRFDVDLGSGQSRE